MFVVIHIFYTINANVITIIPYQNNNNNDSNYNLFKLEF